MTKTIETPIAKHSIKITIASLLIMIIFLMTTTMNFATWKTNMEAEHQEFDDRIIHIGEKVIDMRADIELLNTKANERDIQLAQIQVKLTNIETLLIEIKQDFREKYKE